MDVVVLYIYVLMTIYFIKRFSKHNLKFMPVLYLALLIISSVLSLFFDNELLPGKPDQIGYTEYGYYTAQYLDSINIIEHFTYTADRGHMGYWFLCSVFFGTSLFPIVGLRLLNILLHIFSLIYVHKTMLMLTENKKTSLTATYLWSLSPTVLAFDMYIIRDSIMLSLFIIAAFFLVKLYLKPDFILDKFKLMLVVIPICLLRLHLGISVIIIYVLLFITKIFSRTNWYFGVTACLIIFFTLYEFAFAIEFPRISHIDSLINWALNIETIEVMVWKIALYTSGFGFLDPEREFQMSIGGIIVQRLMAFDSFIVPAIFTVCLFLGKIKKHKVIFYSFFVSYFFYFLTYLYAEKMFSGNYGFHFRAMLPYFYIFYLALSVNLFRYSITVQSKERRN